MIIGHTLFGFSFERIIKLIGVFLNDES